MPFARTACCLLLMLGAGRVGTMLDIGEAGAGKPIATVVGQKIRVTLPENAATGYKWTVGTGCAGVLHLETDHAVAPTSGLVGAGGTHVWVFAAKTAGHCTLAFQLGRSFEATPTGKSVSFPVAVRKAGKAGGAE